MAVFTKTAVDIFAAQDASGAARKVSNHEVQVWGTEVERALAAFQAGGGIIFETKAEADTNLNYAANTMAWVLGDPVASNNGIYQKQGASGSGSWQRVGDLPYSFILATNTNSGNPDAIEATTATPIPAADGGALIALPIVADNTASPVTVSFNGTTPLTIKTASGIDIAPGGLLQNMVIWGYKQGANFRLATDQASAAIQAAAEAAQAAAEAARDVATGAMTTVIDPQFPTVSFVETNFHPDVAPDYIRTAGEVTADDGRGATYVPNGSTSGTLTITLSDGTTTVGYDRAVLPVSADAQTLTEGERQQATDNIAAVSYDPQSPTTSQQEQAWKNINLNRDGKDGVFLTPNIGHRMGQLLYRLDGGRATVLSPWEHRFLPLGWDATPGNLHPNRQAYYVHATNGNDSNSGDSWDDALASIGTAIGKGDRNVIFVAGGLRYDITKFIGNPEIDIDMSIIAVGPPAIIMPQRETTWTHLGNGVYQSDQLGGSPVNVLRGGQISALGYYTPLTQVSTLQEVESTPGSWAIGPNNPSTPSVYVHMPDGGVPTNSNCWVMRSAAHRFEGDGRLVIRNCIFPRGFGARNGGSGSVLAMIDCALCNREDQNGAQILDVDLAIFVRCSASYNFNDGFNYTEFNNKSPHFLEIDCWGFGNLADGTGNISTAHNDVRGYRFNTAGWRSYGKGVADIDTVKTVNVGVQMNDMGVINSSATADGLYFGGTTEVYLHGVRTFGNQGESIVAADSAVVKYRDTFPLPQATDSATVEPY